jgi:hypothetical protein
MFSEKRITITIVWQQINEKAASRNYKPNYVQ